MDWIFLKQAVDVNVPKELEDAFGDWDKAKRDFEKKSYKDIVTKGLKDIEDGVRRMVGKDNEFTVVDFEVDLHISGQAGLFVEADIIILLKPNFKPGGDTPDQTIQRVVEGIASGLKLKSPRVSKDHGGTWVITADWSKSY